MDCELAAAAVAVGGTGVNVAVGGTGVAVGCLSCELAAAAGAVGGTGVDVAVGGTGVAVGCLSCELAAAAVAVGGTESMMSLMALTISSLDNVAVAVGGTGVAVAVGVSSSPATADTGLGAACAGPVPTANFVSGGPRKIRKSRKISKRRTKIVDMTTLPCCRLFCSASLDENIISSLPKALRIYLTCDI